jgi:hypothetical protein
VWRTGVARRSDEGEAQRSRWTFYEAIKYWFLLYASHIEIQVPFKKGSISATEFHYLTILCTFYNPPMKHRLFKPQRRKNSKKIIAQISVIHRFLTDPDPIFDDLVKSRQRDGFGKSSRC